jgi:hypothetical protein
MDPGRHLLLHEQAAQQDQQGAEGAAPAAAAPGVQFNEVWPAAAAAAADGAIQAAGGLAHVQQAFAGQPQGFQAHIQALTARAAVLLAQLQAVAAAAGVQFNLLLPQELGALLAQLHAAAAAEGAALPAIAAAEAAVEAGNAAAVALQAAAAAAAQPAGAVQQGAPLDGQANAAGMLQAAVPVAPQGQALLQQMQQVMPQQQQQQQPIVPQMQSNASPNMLPVTRVIAQLRHLDSLELKGSGLSLETVDPLRNLTRLTRLTMSGVDFDEGAFNSLALSLTGLQRLSIGGSELVGDAALVVVARALRGLTELNVRNCSRVTNRGVLQLTALQHLKVLLVEDTAVSQQVVARVLNRSAALKAGAA